MEKRHKEKETTDNIIKGKTPTQPEEPVGEITSSNDTARRPEHQVGTSPEDQTKGNP